METQNTIKYDSIIITTTMTQIFQLNSAHDIKNYDRSGYKSRHDDFDNLDSFQSCEGDDELVVLSKSGKLTKIRAQFDHKPVTNSSVVLVKVLEIGDTEYDKSFEGVNEPLNKMVSPHCYRPWSPVFTKPI
jgi:hypothetical protein